MTDLTTLSDAELSRHVAHRAGLLLLDLRNDFGPAETPEATTALRKQADRAAHELIVAALAEARPADAILSEEGKDNPDRLTAERVWIVDPLDGTWEYGQGRTDFAVHIALWWPAQGGLHAATVDLPAQGVSRSVLDEVVAIGALPADRPVRIVASRTRPPEALPHIVALLERRLQREGLGGQGVEIVDVGSVGAKVNEILSGRADAYVHDTGFYEWDVAAPHGVAQHYGLVISHVDGRSVTFNHMPPYVPNLMVAIPELAPHLSAAIREATSA